MTLLRDFGPVEGPSTRGVPGVPRNQWLFTELAPQRAVSDRASRVCAPGKQDRILAMSHELTYRSLTDQIGSRPLLGYSVLSEQMP